MTPALKYLILILALLFIVALIYVFRAARDLRDENEGIYRKKLKK